MLRSTYGNVTPGKPLRHATKSPQELSNPLSYLWCLGSVSAWTLSLSSRGNDAIMVVVDEVVSDRDLRFTSAFITGLYSLVGARLAMSTPYHPQTDGQTDGVKRVLEDMLRHYVSPVQGLGLGMGTPKLLPRWVGPFQILREVRKHAYELVLPDDWKIHDTFHVSQLAEYYTSGTYQPPPPTELLEGELEYEIESIKGHRVKNSSTKGRPNFEYLVQWRGFGSDHDTWEPERSLKNVSQVVQLYWD